MFSRSLRLAQTLCTPPFLHLFATSFMYEILKHAHSGLRWLVLIGLVLAIVRAFANRKNAWQDGYRKTALIGLISSHTQLLLGLALYAMTPRIVWAEGMGNIMKDGVMRFWAVEHISMMILGIVLITIGYSKAKRPKAIQSPVDSNLSEADMAVHKINDQHKTDAQRFKSIYVFYTLGLVFILLGVPWPWGKYGVGWF